MIKIQPQAEFVDGESQGFFSLNEQTYRAALGTSQSLLKICMTRSPQATRLPSPPSPLMSLGSICHSILLDKNAFQEGTSHIVRPRYYRDDKGVEKRWNMNANACKSWTEENESRGIPILSPDELAQLNTMAATFRADPFGGMFLERGFTEVSAFCTDPLTGTRLKAMIDLLAESADTIFCGDLKCTADGSQTEFMWTAEKLNYAVQSSFYSTIVREITGRQGTVPDMASVRFIFAALETEPPHYVDFYEIDQQDISAAENKWRRALLDYIEAKRTGDFVRIKPLALPKRKY